MTRSLPPTLALLAALAACQPGFDPPSLVTKNRVLGIVARPPEAPFEGETALEAVVAFPERELTWAWSACPFSLGAEGGYRCLEVQGPEGATVSLEQPLPAQGPEAAFSTAPLVAGLGMLVPAWPQVVGFLKAGLGEDQACLAAVIDTYEGCDQGEPACSEVAVAGFVDCLRTEGLKVQLRLEVGDALEPEPLVAYKSVIFRDRPEGEAANANPVLTGFEVAPRDAADDVEDLPWVAYGPGAEVPVAAGQELAIRPTWDEASVERYRSAAGEEKDEIVYFTWLAATGSLGHERTITAVPDTTWTPPDPTEGDWAPRVDAWIFARDDRGGTDYLRLTFVLGEVAP